MADRDYLGRLERELIDQGKLMEAGWVSYRLLVIPSDAGKVQLESSRNAFFAGAQHLFGSMLSMLDVDAEVTPDDMRRMDLISTELQDFLVEFKRKHGLKP